MVDSAPLQPRAGEPAGYGQRWRPGSGLGRVRGLGPGGGLGSGQRLGQERGRARLPFWLLAGLLVLVFLTGGSARGDVAGLMLLRPVSILLLGVGLVSLEGRRLADCRLLVALAVAALALVLLHLLPLPPAMAHAWPQRAVLADIDRAAGLEGVWRPMTMAPEATRNALWALMPPLAVLVLGLQLSARPRAAMLSLVLALGFASAGLALAQILGDPHGALYAYPITNHGEAVGLFANRNHQAALLAGMIPMLAVWAQPQPGERRAAFSRLGRRQFFGLSLRQFWALLAGLFLIPLILVTGSRSGLLVALVALASLPLFIGSVRSTKAPPFLRAVPLLLLAGAAVLAGLTIWNDRAVAVDRLLARDPADDMRIRIAPVLHGMIRDFLPWGSGFGSFPQVYRLYEPDGLLAPVYMNHAHNDWLELALEGGIPALFLLACAVGGWLARAACLARHRPAREGAPERTRGDERLAWLGLVLMLLFGLASLTDYPLRVPSLACLLALAAVWAAPPAAADGMPGRGGGRSLRGSRRPGPETRLSLNRRNLQCA